MIPKKKSLQYYRVSQEQEKSTDKRVSKNLENGNDCFFCGEKEMTQTVPAK